MLDWKIPIAELTGNDMLANIQVELTSQIYYILWKRRSCKNPLTGSAWQEDTHCGTNWRQLANIRTIGVCIRVIRAYKSMLDMKIPWLSYFKCKTEKNQPFLQSVYSLRKNPNSMCYIRPLGLSSSGSNTTSNINI